jgi:glycosyltransferase involved in cell wall biosynthesis
MSAPATARAAAMPPSHAATKAVAPQTSRANERRSRPLAGSIVIATLNRPLGDTGVHVHTRVLDEGIQRAGLSCDIVSPFDGAKAWLPIFAIRPLLLKRLNKTWATRWYRYWHAAALRANLRRRLRSEQPMSAVIAQCPVSARVALDLRTQLHAKWPVVLVCHFNHSEAREYRAKGELGSEKAFDAMMAFEEDVLREVDQVVYVSGWARDVVENERGVHPKSSRVIWNGLPDLQGKSERRETRAALGLSESDIAVINVGTLEPRKNQLALLDLFAHIAAEHPKARLLLAGDGPQRPAIENRLRELKLTDKVTLLGMRRDVPALLAAADIYLHYATAENCPVVLIEAARAGLPVAAIPAGGVPELQREIGGLDLTQADHEASLAVLQPVLTDAAVRQLLGQRSRAAYERRFALDAMVAAYLQAIDAAHSPEVQP